MTLIVKCAYRFKRSLSFTFRWRLGQPAAVNRLHCEILRHSFDLPDRKKNKITTSTIRSYAFVDMIIQRSHIQNIAVHQQPSTLTILMLTAIQEVNAPPNETRDARATRTCCALQESAKWASAPTAA